MDEQTKIIQEQFNMIPDRLQAYITSGDWDQKFQEVLNQNSIDEKKSEEVKFELFMYLLALQDRRETINQVKATLDTLPSPKTNSIADKLIDVVPYDIKNSIKEVFDLIDNNGKEEKKTPTESQVGVEIIKEEKKPEEKPKMTSSETESSSGVDIIQEEKVPEEKPKAGLIKDSLIQGIEHPEKSAEIEEAAKEGKKYNPVSSKLTEPTKGAPSYKGKDPYREPIE